MKQIQIFGDSHTGDDPIVVLLELIIKKYND